jgi:hypothetical protein
MYLPVNGYVTNLLMRPGDYAHARASNISIIDTDSFWIDGYFEETKLARICVGDRAEAKLMSYAQSIIGHVSTVTGGISVSNSAAGAQGLPNVDSVYTWVRLAQRVLVRIAIDHVPPGGAAGFRADRHRDGPASSRGSSSRLAPSHAEGCRGSTRRSLHRSAAVHELPARRRGRSRRKRSHPRWRRKPCRPSGSIPGSRPVSPRKR